MSNEIRAFKATELRVASDNGKHTLVGYAAVFNSPSEDFGGWSERIDPHAFDRTLSTNPDVRCLVEHDPARIVGRTKSKTLRVRTDSTGLRFECDLPDTSVARDLITSIQRGDLDSCSFGFVTNKESWEEDRQTNTAIRTLLDVDLLDTSVVAYPAYPATSAAVRNFPASMPVEMRSRFERRNDAKTKRVDGEDLTAGDFIYVGDPDKTDTWSLPWHFSTEEKTKSHLRDALSRWDQDQVIPESQKAEAHAKLLRLCKQHGIDVSKESKSKRSMDPNADIDDIDLDVCECCCAQCTGGFHGICSGDPQCDFAVRQMRMRVRVLALKK